jgi:SOS-response transcriptional repressor LexA
MSNTIQSEERRTANGNHTVIRQPLTPKQLRVYKRIARLIEAKPYGPSFREIGKACNLASTKTVSDYVKQLIRKGWLQRCADAESNVRTLQLTAEPKEAA